MKRQLNGLALVSIALVMCMATACQSVSSTARRAGIVALGTAAGGASGYVLGDKDPTKAVVGAVAGGALTHLALGADAEVKQAGFDQGYVQGQSDAIKREYFLRQALQAEAAGSAASGETVYYVMPGPEVTADGRKLEPHQVAVRVVE